MAAVWEAILRQNKKKLLFLLYSPILPLPPQAMQKNNCTERGGRTKRGREMRRRKRETESVCTEG